MQIELLEQVDRVLAALSPERREAVREIVVDAVHRGALTPTGRAFIARVSGSSFLADVLSDALTEQRRALEQRRAPEQDRVE